MSALGAHLALMHPLISGIDEEAEVFTDGLEDFLHGAGIVPSGKLHVDGGLGAVVVDGDDDVSVHGSYLPSLFLI